jgi:hypothetical protein
VDFIFDIAESPLNGELSLERLNVPWRAGGFGRNVTPRRSLVSDVDRGSQGASAAKRGSSLSSDSHPPQGSETKAVRRYTERLLPAHPSLRVLSLGSCLCLKRSSSQASRFGIACTLSAQSMELRQTVPAWRLHACMTCRIPRRSEDECRWWEMVGGPSTSA